MCSFSALARAALYCSSSGFSGFTACCLPCAVVASAVDEDATSAMMRSIKLKGRRDECSGREVPRAVWGWRWRVDIYIVHRGQVIISSSEIDTGRFSRVFGEPQRPIH